MKINDNLVRAGAEYVRCAVERCGHTKEQAARYAAQYLAHRLKKHRGTGGLGH